MSGKYPCRCLSGRPRKDDIKISPTIVHRGWFRFTDGYVISASIINHGSGSLHSTLLSISRAALKDSPTNDQHDLLFYGQEKAKRLLVESRDIQMEVITEKRHQCIGGLTSMKIDGSDLYIFSRDLCR